MYAAKYPIIGYFAPQKMRYSMVKLNSGRADMNKRKDLLDSVRNMYFDTRDRKCKTFLNRLCRYYKQTDYETGRKHGEIFRSLYLTEKPPTYDELSAQYYIDAYTLDRYRQRYNRLAEYLISDELLKQINTANTVR